MCPPGKKLNHGGEGKECEINLFGHEGPPKLTEKYSRLNNEISAVEEHITWLEGLLIQDKTMMYELSQNEKETIMERGKHELEIIAIRISELRKHKVKKNLGKEKFKKMGGSDWRISKYAFVVNAIQTAILQIEQTISQLLKCSDDLLHSMAAVNMDNNFCCGNVVNLNHQRNFFCLKDTKEHGIDTRFQKQRSNEWLTRRKDFKITGNLSSILTSSIFI